MSLLKLFCNVDDFWQAFQPHWRRVTLARNRGRRVRATRLSPSEIMTILIHFHQSHYRTFKAYYTEHVLIHRRPEFPGLVSYNRFVELTPTVQFHVMTVGPVHRQTHRNALGFGQPATLDPAFAAVSGVGAGFSPPKGDLVMAPSRLTQLQSSPFSWS